MRRAWRRGKDMEDIVGFRGIDEGFVDGRRVERVERRGRGS